MLGEISFTRRHYNSFKLFLFQLVLSNVDIFYELESLCLPSVHKTSKRNSFYAAIQEENGVLNNFACALILKFVLFAHSVLWDIIFIIKQ